MRQTELHSTDENRAVVDRSKSLFPVGIRCLVRPRVSPRIR